MVAFPFPQTNLQSGKRRPALVVADLAGDDLVLCQIAPLPVPASRAVKLGGTVATIQMKKVE